MPKVTSYRAKELQPKKGVIRPTINGKARYQRIPIAKREPFVLRHDNRLFIGEVTAGEVVRLHECHPDTIPEEIVPNGMVRELKFGRLYKVGVFEPITDPENMEEEGGEG